MFRPLFNNVLIEPLEGEQKTESGIFIPDTAKEKPQKGKVIAVGKTKSVAVGDVVIYKKWGGTEIKLDGKDYLVVEDKDIIGIL